MSKTQTSKQENKKTIPTTSQDKEEKTDQLKNEIEQLKKKNQQKERENEQLKEQIDRLKEEIERLKQEGVESIFIDFPGVLILIELCGQVLQLLHLTAQFGNLPFNESDV